MKKILIALSLGISLLGMAGCNKKQTVKIPVATNTTPTTPKKRDPQFPKNPKTPDGVVDVSKSDGKFAPLFFTYDESTLSDAAMLELDEIALFLEEHPAATLLISGHADERGTEEYNMALGQERAESIKRYLTYMRIDPSRINTVSYGEEMPLSEGLDEESLAMNRRGEFQVSGPVGAPVASKTNKKVIERPILRPSLSPKLLGLGKIE